MRKQLRYIYTLCIYIYIYDTSIFPFLGSLTETTSIVCLCALVKQSDQDEGVHEMTAMSWKLGEGSTERSFTKVYIVEVPWSLFPECKRIRSFLTQNLTPSFRCCCVNKPNTQTQKFAVNLLIASYFLVEVANE